MNGQGANFKKPSKNKHCSRKNSHVRKACFQILTAAVQVMETVRAEGVKRGLLGGARVLSTQAGDEGWPRRHGQNHP